MRVARLLMCVILTACAGSDGATGPAGPAGALNRFDGSGVFPSTGRASVALPAASVSTGRLPIIQCYTSEDGSTWLAIAQTPSNSFPFCGLNTSSSSPSVAFSSGIPGWRYHVVVGW